MTSYFERNFHSVYSIMMVASVFGGMHTIGIVILVHHWLPFARIDGTLNIGHCISVVIVKTCDFTLYSRPVKRYVLIG